MISAFLTLSLASLALGQVNVPSAFTPGVKWQIEIQTPISPSGTLLPSDALVWDIDLYHAAANPRIIPYIRSQIPGAIVICYFNAGLVQPSDCDYKSTWANSGLLGNRHPDPGFEEESFIDVRNPRAVDLIGNRITLAARIGCDGVDPDNIDTYHYDENGTSLTGFNLTKTDLITFIQSLATFSHNINTTQGNTLLIGQKNAAELTANVSSSLDFAVLENCHAVYRQPDRDTEPFCAAYQDAYSRAGKPVLSIEYPPTLGSPATGACNARGVTQADYNCTCGSLLTADKDGFSTVLKIQGGIGELNGCTQYCGAGVGREVVVTRTEEGEEKCPGPYTTPAVVEAAAAAAAGGVKVGGRRS